MGVPLNYTFIDGFSIKNHPAIGGTPMTMETPIYQVWVAPFSHCPLNFYTLVINDKTAFMMLYFVRRFSRRMWPCQQQMDRWIRCIRIAIYTMHHNATSRNIMKHPATSCNRIQIFRGGGGWVQGSEDGQCPWCLSLKHQSSRSIQFPCPKQLLLPPVTE